MQHAGNRSFAGYEESNTPEKGNIIMLETDTVLQKGGHAVSSYW